MININNVNIKSSIFIISFDIKEHKGCIILTKI